MPKHADPDPDMRVSRHPGCTRNAVNTSATSGSWAIAERSRDTS